MASWAERAAHEHVSAWVSLGGSPRVEKLVLEAVTDAIREAVRRCEVAREAALTCHICQANPTLCSKMHAPEVVVLAMLADDGGEAGGG
jgi:hypothetical protein